MLGVLSPPVAVGPLTIKATSELRTLEIEDGCEPGYPNYLVLMHNSIIECLIIVWMTNYWDQKQSQFLYKQVKYSRDNNFLFKNAHYSLIRVLFKNKN